MSNIENEKKSNDSLTVFVKECDYDPDDVVVIPRDEYDELIAESTILRVVEQLVKHSRYASDTLENLRVVLDIGEHEEDEPQPTEEANE